MAEGFSDILTKGLREMGISLPEGALSTYTLYQRELKTWSRAYNITGLKHDRDIAIRLFLDSLLYLKVFPELIHIEAKPPKVVDIGSGGGFPGVVLKIARPELDLTLIEPSWKRIAFLRHISKKLHLPDIRVIQSTLEEHVKQARGEVYDIILTKALFKTYDFIKKTEEITSQGSVLILSKGPGYRKELKEVYSGLGGKIKGFNIETRALKLPLTTIKRYFIKVTVLGQS